MALQTFNFQQEDPAIMEGLYTKAVAVVREEGRASASLVQRKLGIGYNRAWDLMDMMQERGVVSAPNHVGKREILK